MGRSSHHPKVLEDPYQVNDLIAIRHADAASGPFPGVRRRASQRCIVSGGTGTGKTTTLNVLSSFIPADERIVTIEDAKELQLHQDHVLAMEARPPNIEGRGEVTIRDLVKNSLRMRPDRIVVGECRGGEALDMLQAMNTGHDGRSPPSTPTAARHVVSYRDDDDDGRVRPAGPGHPRADGFGARPHHPPRRLRRATPPHHAHDQVQGMEGDVITSRTSSSSTTAWVLMSTDAAQPSQSTGVREVRGEACRPGIRLGADVFQT